MYPSSVSPAFVKVWYTWHTFQSVFAWFLLAVSISHITDMSVYSSFWKDLIGELKHIVISLSILWCKSHSVVIFWAFRHSCSPPASHMTKHDYLSYSTCMFSSVALKSMFNLMMSMEMTAFLAYSFAEYPADAYARGFPRFLETPLGG